MRSPASFRDPDSGVVLRTGKLLRFFVGAAIHDYEYFGASGLARRLSDAGSILPIRPAESAEFPDVPPNAVVVEQDLIPFISYAYEWPFEMLKTAARFHLGVALEALEAGMMLKDATSDNVQFLGPRPIFIDLGSFARYEGGHWAAYAQFCRTLLNPLVLRALARIPFQPLLRSHVEGLTPELTNALLPLRHKLKRSLLTHVVLHAYLNRGDAIPAGTSVAAPPGLAKKNLRRLLLDLDSLIASLQVKQGDTPWSNYDDRDSYVESARAAKHRFVEGVLRSVRPSVVWDLGSNVGEYSFAAARAGAYVVAIDGDEGAANELFRRARETESKVLPLVMNLRDPSPDQGWSQRERLGLQSRGPTPFFLSLALVHHLALGGNVPVALIVAWLADLGAAGIVEFVPKTDPMARELLRWRRDVFGDYSVAGFESALSRHFRISSRFELPESERVLYHVVRH